jgi:hypothetical protein
VWSLLESVFLGAYFGQLRKSGQPALSYSISVNNPIQSTLQLGAISHECSPLMNDGQPISNPTQQDLNATTYIYLGSTTTTPPTPVMFPWNWVELGDLTAFSGVQATRRAVFFNFLANLLNSDVAALCVDTVVSLSHNDQEYSIGFNAGQAARPGTFQLIATPGAAAPDGFTDVMTLSFASNHSGDDSISAPHSAIHGEFNYNLTGSTAVNSNQIRVQLTAQAYMKFTHDEIFVWYTDLDGQNYYNKTLTVVFTLGVDQNGKLQVTQTNNLVDNSVAFNFTPKGLMSLGGAEDGLRNGLTQVEQSLAGALDSAFTGYVDGVTQEINGYQGWVFPGANSFVCKNVAFSSGLDLITQLTYANPS